MTIEEIETKIKTLRERYLNEPWNRPTIELQGRALKTALSIAKKGKNEKEIVEALL